MLNHISRLLIAAFFFGLTFVGDASAKPVAHYGTHGNTMKFHRDPTTGGRFWVYNNEVWKRKFKINLACTKEDREQYGDRCVLGLHWNAFEGEDGWYMVTYDHDVAPLRLFAEEYKDLPRSLRDNVTHKFPIPKREPVDTTPLRRTATADPAIPSLHEGSSAADVDPEIPDL